MAIRKVNETPKRRRGWGLGYLIWLCVEEVWCGPIQSECSDITHTTGPGNSGVLLCAGLHLDIKSDDFTVGKNPII